MDTYIVLSWIDLAHGQAVVWATVPEQDAQLIMDSAGKAETHGKKAGYSCFRVYIVPGSVQNPQLYARERLEKEVKNAFNDVVWIKFVEESHG